MQTDRIDKQNDRSSELPLKCHGTHAEASTKQDRSRSNVQFYRRAAARRALLVAMAVLLLASSSVYGQNYNPNNYDSAKIVQAFLHPRNDLVLIVAHRGLHADYQHNNNAENVPENSLQSIGLAAQRGAEAIEVDIKLTSDNEPVLSHDTHIGREAATGFNPFDAQTPDNDQLNPAVNGLTFAQLSTYFLQDSVQFYKSAEKMPSLYQVLDYMTANKIASVLFLDIKDSATAQACWQVVKNKMDADGNPYSKKVVFKMPGSVYKTPADFQQAFGGDANSVLFLPFYGTANISPAPLSTNVLEEDDYIGGQQFGGEPQIIASIRAFQQSGISLMGTEVNLKQSGGILTDVLAAAKVSNSNTPASVGNFQPTAEYQTLFGAAQFFVAAGSRAAYCCYVLSDLFYNGSANNQPSDTADNRNKLTFMLSNGYDVITTDLVSDAQVFFSQNGKRNISYMQAATGATRSIVDLRVMPIGDSITEGYETGPYNGNGYRYPLQQDIKNLGQTITFVGDQVDGTMTNPQNEGFSGKEIDYIAARAVPSAASWRPNVALVLAGTNDVNLKDDLAGAPARLDSMIGSLFQSAPDATMLVAGIPPSYDPTFNTNRLAFNASVQTLVSNRQNSGQHIQYVDLNDLDPNADKSDSLHPNDAGYQKIGDDFNNAIQNVMDQGWVTAPVAITRTTGGGGSAGTAKHPVGPQPGAGTMNNIGQIAAGIGADPKTSFLQFADINGDGKADYLSIDANGATTVYFSGGLKPDGTWNLYPLNTGLLATGIGEPGANVRFADINGDGRADYLTVDANGLTRAYLNGGAKTDGSTNWIPAPYPNQVIATGIGASGSSIQFGDINGDGYADYLAIDENGAITGYLNGGPNPDGSGWIWYPIAGQVASGVGAPKGSRYQIADINNDGWGDYIVFDGVNGTVHAWVNGGITSGGTWIWYPQGQIVPGNGAASKLHTPILADLDGDGKADYLALNWGGSVNAWLNNGKDTSTVAGWLPLGEIANADPNLRWADIDGDGLADYITVDLTSGAAYAYLNGGRRADGSWIWYPHNQIAAGECGDFKNCYIEFGDINGDGKADYLVGDYTSGITAAWLSGGVNAADGSWIWVPQGTAPIGFTLEAGTVIQWVDLNNDKYADMVMTTPEGVTTALQNFGPGAGGWPSSARLAPLGTISNGPSLSNGYAANRFADINNDGQADLLTVLTDGGLVASINLGSGSGWFSGVESVIAGGIGAPGSQIQFADLDGDGRADYLVVPSTGNITAWLNNGGDNYQASY